MLLDRQSWWQLPGSLVLASIQGQSTLAQGSAGLCISAYVAAYAGVCVRAVMPVTGCMLLPAPMQTCLPMALCEAVRGSEAHV